MLIKSINNNLIKNTKKLYQKKYRWREKKYIIEGYKIIKEALDNDITICNIFVSENNINDKETIGILNIINEKLLTIVSEEVFKYISDTETPQGVLAVVEFSNYNLMEDITANSSFLLYLDRIQDPGNLGTMIRSMDAFNLDGIILGKGTVDPYNPKVVRATMGSIFRVPIYNLNKIGELKEFSEKRGFNIISTSLDGTKINNINWEKRTICIIGNEGQGVHDELQHMSKELVKIPMPGDAESLNAGVAASIIMYEAMKEKL